MNQQTDITQKNYRQLILEIGLDGFGFAVKNTFTNKIDVVKNVDFATLNTSEKVEDLYWKAFLANHELTKNYDSVLILHRNAWQTFVPQSLFDQDYLASYLQYSSKVFDTDSFAFDALKNHEINNVFVPFANLNNFLLEQFEHCVFKHSTSVLVDKLLEISKNKLEKQMYCHFGKNSFELMVAENQKLLLFNSFEIATAADFIYYVLFTAEQLGLNTEHVELRFLGNVSQESDFFKMAFKYVRHVDMLDVSILEKQNTFDAHTNREHFIMLNS